MTCQRPIRPRRGAPLAAALLLLITLVAAPAAGADSSGSITVSAGIVDPNQQLSLTICETEANFGTGLTHDGAQPTGASGGSVTATSEGTEPGQGVFYRWWPECQASGMGPLFTVESDGSFLFGWCMEPNSGTNPDLTEQDLRWTTNPYSMYAQVLGGVSYPFARCPTLQQNVVTDPSTPTHMLAYLYLRVDDHVDEGTFQTTTTWMVQPN